MKSELTKFMKEPFAVDADVKSKFNASELFWFEKLWDLLVLVKTSCSLFGKSGFTWKFGRSSFRRSILTVFNFSWYRGQHGAVTG